MTRSTLVWIMLIVATCGSIFVGVSDTRQSPTSDMPAIIMIMAITFLKIRFIMLDFMELRTAPRMLRLGGEAWVIASFALMVTLYAALRAGLFDV